MSLVAPVFAAAPEQGESFNAEVNSEANAEVDAKVDAARAELIARRFEANATVLTIFDRAGKVVTTVGENLLFGTPDYVAEKIEELQNELNLQHLQVWSNFPGMDHDVVMKSIRMFSEQVMPRFMKKAA